jgi:hypothetical protein
VSARPNPFQLTVPTHIVLNGHGAGTAVIRDTGTQALTITVAPFKLSGASSHACALSHAGGIRVSPARFALLPGHAETVTVHAPAIANQAVVFTAQGTGTGNARVSGAIASRIIDSASAHVTACGQHVAAPIVHAAAAGGTSLVTWVAVGAVVLVAAAVVAITARRRHRAAQA